MNYDLRAIFTKKRLSREISREAYIRLTAAAAAVVVTASAAKASVAVPVEDEENEDYDPNVRIVKNVAKASHSIIVLSVFRRAFPPSDTIVCDSIT